ncbi:MAG: SDR family oxidoreductase [Myxococcales bacterium]|nr:MAG: SDR family oxidoreductase [Myxococcales bacterium]
MMNQALSLKGKTAIVTGGGRGIGKAIALELAGLGADVALLSRKKETLEKAAQEIAAQCGVKAIAIPCHCGKEDQIQMAVAQAADSLGRLDILVNNAGTNPHFGPAIDGTPELLRKILDVNLVGYYSMIQAVAPHFQKQGGGAIVNLASIAGLSPSPFMGLYSISKAGVISLTQMFARELGPLKIRVNAVAPGLIKTDFSQVLWTTPAIMEEALKPCAIPRIGEPEEAARIAAFLCTDAASYITGAIYVADGGASV